MIRRLQPSILILLLTVLALAPLLLFGLWWPHDMWDHFVSTAHALQSPAP